MNVRLIAVTQPVPAPDINLQTSEDVMVWCARESSPETQALGLNPERLLGYCMRKKHWSVFTMANMIVHVETSRAISAQILRHWTLHAQEFSQRYAKVQGFETYAARRQDEKNRQSSHDDFDNATLRWFQDAQKAVQDMSWNLYDQALEMGVAKECARFLLPIACSTRLALNGTVRSWIHYFDARRAPETQLEHREIADAIWEIFKQQFPVTAEAISG